MSAHLRLVEPRNKNRSVRRSRSHAVPLRPTNAKLRQREYLTPKEVEKLIKTARDGRYGNRDATLILIAFRHGLRASEICDLEWGQVEFGRSASLHVRRAKNGKPSVHPLRGDEIRALRELQRPDSRHVFGTWWSIHARCRQSIDQAHRRACRFRLPGSRPHAAPRLRLRIGERRARH